MSWDCRVAILWMEWQAGVKIQRVSWLSTMDACLDYFNEVAVCKDSQDCVTSETLLKVKGRGLAGKESSLMCNSVAAINKTELPLWKWKWMDGLPEEVLHGHYIWKELFVKWIRARHKFIVIQVVLSQSGGYWGVCFFNDPMCKLNFLKAHISKHSFQTHLNCFTIVCVSLPSSGKTQLSCTILL